MVEVLKEQTDRAGNLYKVLAECEVPIDGTLRVGKMKWSLIGGNLTVELVKSERYGLQIVISLWGGEYQEREDSEPLPHNRIELCVPVLEGINFIKELVINLQR